VLRSLHYKVNQVLVCLVLNQLKQEVYSVLSQQLNHKSMLTLEVCNQIHRSQLVFLVHSQHNQLVGYSVQALSRQVKHRCLEALNQSLQQEVYLALNLLHSQQDYLAVAASLDLNLLPRQVVYLVHSQHNNSHLVSNL
jgi:flagellar motor switch protein FliG